MQQSEGWTDPSVTEIPDVVRAGQKMSDEEAIAKLTTFHITKILKRDGKKNDICVDLVHRQGALLAHRLAALQKGYDNMGPITTALIGGIGIGWGPTLVKGINLAFDRMKAINEMLPSWSHTPDVRVGAIPSDDTNLIGNIHYMLALAQD